jgi:hypothetical protein
MSEKNFAAKVGESNMTVKDLPASPLELLDVSNFCMLAMGGGQPPRYVFLNPPTRFTEWSADQALVAAAWLVSMAEPFASVKFEDVLRKVRRERVDRPTTAQGAKHMTGPLSSKPLLDRTPTAEEYALLREAYAETYPVRPLMNAIDAKDAEIERLRADLQSERRRLGIEIDETMKGRTEIERLTRERNVFEIDAQRAERISAHRGEQIKRLCAALRAYGKHDANCRLMGTSHWDRRCTCELDEALRGADETDSGT